MTKEIFETYEIDLSIWCIKPVRGNYPAIRGWFYFSLIDNNILSNDEIILKFSDLGTPYIKIKGFVYRAENACEYHSLYPKYGKDAAVFNWNMLI